MISPTAIAGMGESRPQAHKLVAVAGKGWHISRLSASQEHENERLNDAS
jgi:hypothetical protein